MKNFQKRKLLLLGIWAILVVPLVGWGQQQPQPSRIVEIKDPETAFHNRCDEIRECFSRIGKSSNWEKAEQAVNAANQDPDNVDLQMAKVSARADVMDEMLRELRAATKAAKDFEAAYRNHVDQIDAEITDSMANLKSNDLESAADRQFLVDSLAELVKLSEQIPDLILVSTGTESSSEAMNLSSEEQLVLNEFENLVNAAERQVNLLDDAKVLSQETIAILAQMKIAASREYLDIRRAVSRAKHDQVQLGLIAKNETMYVQRLETQQRLEKMQERGQIEYPSPEDRSKVLEGEYTPAPGYRGDDQSIVLRTLVNQERIDRLQVLVGPKENELVAKQENGKAEGGR